MLFVDVESFGCMPRRAIAELFCSSCFILQEPFIVISVVAESVFISTNKAQGFLLLSILVIICCLPS